MTYKGLYDKANRMLDNNEITLEEWEDMIAPLNAEIESDRKKGKWIKKMRVTETEKYTSYDPEWYCACCGTMYDPHVAKVVNFCYVCGADMIGEQDGCSNIKSKD